MRTSVTVRRGQAVFAMVLWAACSACSAAPDATENVGEQQADLLAGFGFIYDGLNAPATQCTVGGQGMHCCPTDYAMIGLHADRNVFKCAPIRVPRVGAPFLDTGTQRAGMHSCPFSSVMIGLRADKNRLACQRVAVPSGISEFVDNGTQDTFPMHVCAGGTSMSGVRLDRNQLNCADGSGTIASCRVGSECGSLGCVYCNDGSTQSTRIISCSNPFSPLCQVDNLCAGHGGENPNLGCVEQP